ncbi:hypothetical protein MKEN_00948600 [Mycena kentingensis (nom. inval.)]|nr:hypothetical protein MKEN_00948600 [Mycena kentingensis (nom. inval.)]
MPQTNDAGRLPPELEMKIFLLVAHDSEELFGRQLLTKLGRLEAFEGLLVLPRVCRRVQAWVEPLLYERVNLQLPRSAGPSPSRVRHPVERFMQTLAARPASFFARHVKCIYLDTEVSLADTRRILSVCTGATSIACFQSYPALADVLVALPLQRLLVQDLLGESAQEQGQAPRAGMLSVFTNLFQTSRLVIDENPGPVPSQQPAPLAAAPWTSTLTHLALTHTLPPPAALSALPSLTHLALDYNTFGPHAIATPGLLQDQLTRVLTDAPRLERLVVVVGTPAKYRGVALRLQDDKGLRLPGVDKRVHAWLRLPGELTWSCWGRRACLDADAGVSDDERMAYSSGAASPGRDPDRRLWGDMFEWADREAARLQR